MSKTHPSLALIVPAYNSAKYLPDLFASIYGGASSLGELEPQTLLPTEVIVCDDCSTDDTEKVVIKYRKLHPEISYIKLNRNSGTPVACNRAIESTTCRFITRIDSDDMRESSALEELMQVQESNPHSIVYDDVRIFLNGKKQSNSWVMGEYDFETLLSRNFIHAGIMFPRKAWEECGGYPEEFIHGRDDWSFNVSLGIFGYCGIHVNNPGYLYRREKQNRTLRTKSSEWQARFDQAMHEKFSEVYAGRYPMGCCGNRRTRVSEVSKSSPSLATIVGGEAGMTLIRYLGGNYGTEKFYGPATGIAYKFSVSSPLRNVDDRDLHSPKSTGLLDLHVGSNALFRVEVVAPSAPSVDETPQAPAEDALTFSSPQMEETLAPTGTPIESGQVTGITVKVVKKLADEDVESWEQFLAKSSSELAEITGLSVERVNAIKRDITA